MPRLEVLAVPMGESRHREGVTPVLQTRRGAAVPRLVSWQYGRLMAETTGTFRLHFTGGPLGGREWADQSFAPDELPLEDSTTHWYVIQGVPVVDPARASNGEPVVLIAQYAWVPRNAGTTQ
mgnify:CR=1 FL=1